MTEYTFDFSAGDCLPEDNISNSVDCVGLPSLDDAFSSVERRVRPLLLFDGLAARLTTADIAKKNLRWSSPDLSHADGIRLSSPALQLGVSSI
jgi:hypothetical protein